MNKPKEKKKYKTLIPLFVIILILGGAVASQFFGPTKGWVTNVKETVSKKLTSATLDENSITTNEVNQKYKAFYDEYMKEVTNLPQIGRRYPVVTIDNSIRDGVLTKRGKDNIYLSEVKPYNAKTSIHYSKLRPDMAKYFFPEKLAKAHADKMLKKYLSGKKIIDTTENETTFKDMPDTKPIAEQTDKTSL